MKAHESAIILLALVFSAGWLPIAYASTSIRGQLIMDVATGWESRALSRPWVLYDGSSFMMWYSGEDNLGTTTIGLATSTDGVSWSRYSGNPVLKVGAPGQWDSGSVNEAAVIRDGAQYKMWYSGALYFGNGSIQKYQIGYATSSDGINWARYSGNPVLTTDGPVAWDDKWVWRPTVISTSSGYVMYFRGVSFGSPAAKAGVATSTDGMHWTKTTVLTMPPGASGWDAYSRSIGSLNLGNVMKTGNTYVMAYSSIKTKTSQSEIGAASSTDGINWAPYSDNPVITFGQSGWDSNGVISPMMVAVGNQYLVYYHGLQLHGPTRIGLAILPMSQYPIPEYPLTTLSLLATMLVLIATLTCLRKRTGFQDQQIQLGA